MAIDDVKLNIPDLPQYCALSLSAVQLAETSNQIESTQPICLNFTTTDVGYLCQSPELTMTPNKQVQFTKFCSALQVYSVTFCFLLLFFPNKF